jgi:hypothetical protein
MYQVVRTVQSDIDLLEIWLHFARENTDRADEALNMIERRYQNRGLLRCLALYTALFII